MIVIIPGPRPWAKLWSFPIGHVGLRVFKLGRAGHSHWSDRVLSFPIGRAGFGAFYWSSWVWGFPTGRAAKWVPSIWLCLFRDYGHSYGSKVQFFVVSSVTYMHFAVMHLVGGGGGGRGWPGTAEVQLHAYWLDVCSRVVMQIFSLQNWIKIGFLWKIHLLFYHIFAKLKEKMCET